MEKNFEINCPCCESLIVIDRVSGEILFHKQKVSSTRGSLEEMVTNLEVQKSESEKRFDREIASQKDRKRLLEEKFKEAMERADKSDKPMINPMDLD